MFNFITLLGDPEYIAEQDAALSAMIAFYISYFSTLLFTTTAMSLVTYIFTGKALSSLSRRRSVGSPWMAWVPFANVYLLGALSDDFRSKAYGENTRRGKKLLIQNIVASLLICAMCVAYIWALVLAVSVDSYGGGMEPQVMVVGLGLLLLATLGLCIAALVVAVIYCILYYKSLYDIFRSCDPDKAVLWLLLSIFVFPAVFLFIGSKKDEGMPVPVTEGDGNSITDGEGDGTADITE